MIIPFLTPEQFQQKLVLVILIQIIIMVCMINFARRNPTDYDTKYTRRWRIINGVFWIIIACSQLFLTQKSFLTPLYYFGIYGTFTPSPDMIATGLTENEIIREYGRQVIWGHLTFPQWVLESQIKNFLTFLSIGLYFLFYKPSSVKRWAKIRKVIGYFLLLFFVPSSFNFHYFDVWEFTPALFVVLLVYLCTRSYKRDAKPASIPKESESHQNIAEFEPILPEENIYTGNDNPNGISDEKIKHKAAGLWEKIRNLPNLLWWIMGIIAFFLLVTWGLIICKDWKPSYASYEKYHVWIEESGGWSIRESIEECTVDFRLGNPISMDCICLERMQTSRFNGFPDARYEGKTIYETYCKHEISTYDISSLGYSAADKEKYLDYVAKSNNGKIYNVETVGNNANCVGYGYVKELKSEVYIATDKPADIIIAAAKYGKLVTSCKHMNVYVQVFCEGKYAYQVKTYTLAGVDKEHIISHLYFSNPNRHIDNSLIVCVILLMLSALCLIFCFVHRTKQETISNKRLKRLLWYILISIVLQIIFIAICTLSTCIFDDDYEMAFIAIIWLYPSILLVDIPAFIYVWSKREKEDSLDSLIPDWYKKHFIASYRNDVTCTKLSLVLIFYPLFYMATLPCGWFVSFYLVPMSAIFALVYFVRWIFKDSEQQENPVRNRENKQVESTGNTLKEKLQLLKSMLDEGLITQDDYDRKKADIIDKIQE